MPVHDWTRAEEFLFHSFQLAWRAHLSGSLNSGFLPETHYAQTGTVEHPGGPLRTYAKGHVVIHRASDHQPVAAVEIVEPADKTDPAAIGAFVRRAVEQIRAGVHLLVIDLFPPGRHDPAGMHQAIWGRLGEDCVPAIDRPFVVASYDAGSLAAYLEPLAIGDPLPTMPLFFAAERYVNLPLEPSYEAAWRGVPGFWREVIEGRGEPVTGAP